MVGDIVRDNEERKEGRLCCQDRGRRECEKTPEVREEEESGVGGGHRGGGGDVEVR